jgi:hypothetical protein
MATKHIMRPYPRSTRSNQPLPAPALSRYMALRHQYLRYGCKVARPHRAQAATPQETIVADQPSLTAASDRKVWKMTRTAA